MKLIPKGSIQAKRYLVISEAKSQVEKEKFYDKISIANKFKLSTNNVADIIRQYNNGLITDEGLLKSKELKC